MRYEPIDKELFTANRARFRDQLAPGALAIIPSNGEFPRSGDQNYPFRQNSDLFYLTGINQEDTLLILFPDHSVQQHRQVLFLKETNEHIAIWEGEKLSKKQASAISGIEERQIHWLSSYESIISGLIHYAQSVFLNTNENDRYALTIPGKDYLFAQSFRDRYPLHQLHRAAPIFRRLRTIKSPLEIELLQKAVSITANAFARTLAYIRPGTWEFEIEAEITHQFTIERSEGHAYSPIIAAGPSACVLHYNTNHKQCPSGQLVLMDFGASYANYNADLTRTIPVNGRFSPRQKEVYEAVHRILNQAKSLLVPGTPLHDYRTQTDQMMIEELKKLGLIPASGKTGQDPSGTWKNYYPHGISHYLGLDVHDLGDRQEIIQEGMVFTCEPGIYIAKEGLGIRLENDLVITEKGNIDLMADIPIEWEEIEELMNP